MVSLLYLFFLNHWRGGDTRSNQVNVLQLIGHTKLASLTWFRDLVDVHYLKYDWIGVFTYLPIADHK